MNLYSTLILSTALASTSLATRVATVDEAKTKAQENQVNTIVLVHGSPWSPINATANSTFTNASMENDVGSKHMFVSVEWNQNLETSDPAFAGNQSVLGIPKSLPCLIILDSNGRIVRSYSGPDEIHAGGDQVQCAKTAIQECEKRDTFWKQAESATGTTKADLLGQGLDAIPAGANSGNYQAAIEQIKAADPDGTTGYHAKYTFNVYGNNGMVYNLVNQQKFAEAETNLSDILKNPKLSIEQRQQVQASRFALYERWAEKKSMQKGVLEAMRDLGPTTRFGVMASRYLTELKL